MARKESRAELEKRANRAERESTIYFQILRRLAFDGKPEATESVTLPDDQGRVDLSLYNVKGALAGLVLERITHSDGQTEIHAYALDDVDLKDQCRADFHGFGDSTAGKGGALTRLHAKRAEIFSADQAPFSANWDR